MTDILAAVAYRLLAPRATGGTNPGSGDDLKNVVTTDLPNHAMCWAAINTLLQLDKNNNASAELILPSGEPVIIVPNSGPGRWVAIAGRGATGFSQEMYSTVTATPAGQGVATWVQLGNLTWNTVYLATSSLWTASAIGVLTYLGPPRRFQASANITVLNTVDDTANVEFYIDRNSSVIGLTTALDETGRSGTSPSTEVLPTQISTSVLRDMVSGDTLQMTFRVTSGDDHSVMRAAITIVPAD